MVEQFKLEHNDGKLTAVAIIDGRRYEKDVTEYFKEPNPHDDWLCYRLTIKRRNRTNGQHKR